MKNHVAVIGAGVFGAWTAHHLLNAGHRVTLIDAWGPANSRASSGGESRLTRAAYGKDAIYTRMARDSLPQWKALSAVSGLPERAGYYIGYELAASLGRNHSLAWLAQLPPARVKIEARKFLEAESQ